MLVRVVSSVEPSEKSVVPTTVISEVVDSDVSCSGDVDEGVEVVVISAGVVDSEVD